MNKTGVVFFLHHKICFIKQNYVIFLTLFDSKYR